MYIEESFRASRGPGPGDWLVDMRKALAVSTEIKNGSHKNNLTQSVAYLLQLADAQYDLDHELTVLGHPDGKTIADGKAETALTKLERLSTASTDMHQRATESLDALRSLVALVEQLKGTSSEKPAIDSPGRNKKLWDDITSKHEALDLAHAHLRQAVLGQF
jgi:hypothetical protein